MWWLDIGDAIASLQTPKPKKMGNATAMQPKKKNNSLSLKTIPFDALSSKKKNDGLTQNYKTQKLSFQKSNKNQINA